MSGHSALNSPRVGHLSDVPEEGPITPPPSNTHHNQRSPYINQAGATSATTFKPAASSSSLASASSSGRGPAGPRPANLLRTATRASSGETSVPVGRVSSGETVGPMGRVSRAGSPATLKERDRDSVRESVNGKERERDKDRDTDKERGKERSTLRSDAKSVRDVPSTPTPGPGFAAHRVRNTPHLPHSKDAEPVPATLMYWSRAPVYGTLPAHGVRAHSVTLVDTMAWVFGGCDEKGCWRDVFCFNTETMQWSHPEMLGDIPPPCRAHTATLIDRRIVVFGGGEGPVYYNDVYILDTAARRWTHVVFPEGSPIPPPRRAHTAVYYRGKVWLFGGGNGMEALNDVWTLEVSSSVERMRWEQVETRGKKPTPRGYHTANLIGNVMVVVGGSDGRECFSDIWCLNLDTLSWSLVKLDEVHRRLSHTATQVGSYLFIVGGHDGNQYTSDLLLFNLVSLSYEKRATAGRPPSPRGYHVAFLADSRVFVFGGFNGNDVYEDINILDLAGAAYLPQVTSFKIDVD